MDLKQNEDNILKLIKKSSTRDRGYSLLIDKYAEMVYWQVRRMVLSHEDADDLVQEIFIKVFENIESFHNESKLSTWIYRIAYNHTINHIKSKSTRLSKNNSSFEQEMFENLKSDSLFDGNEIELKLQKAMLSLPAKQRAVFQMRYYEEFSFSQIAEITKTSEGALKASYHIAAKKIEEMMLNEDFSI
jgi:RNA polymerase sigma-70 factor (ECF subfamily)